jgi:hypothetical protein
MKTEPLNDFIHTLDAMIAALDAGIVFGRTAKEREACELLKDARIKLIEEVEARKGGEHVDQRSRA